MESFLDPWEYGRRLGSHALGFAAGLLFMLWPALTFWQRAYIASNPAAGPMNVYMEGVLFFLAMFVVGATLAFVSVATALYRVLRDARTPGAASTGD